ncbi:MAG: VWA domain-containing protein [Acidobacteriota bacterium]
MIDLETIVPARRGGAPPLPGGARRHFLLLFDLSFSDPSSVTQARAAARDIVLDQLHPTDLVAVASYSLETGPRLLVTFTSDRSQVARALDLLSSQRRINADPLSFVLRDSIVGESNSVSSSIGADAPSANVDLSGRDSATDSARIVLNQIDRSERRFQRSQITAMSRSMGEMARLLDSTAGRKQVILFSEGFDSRLLLGEDVQTTDNRSGLDNRALNIQRGNLFLVDSDDLYGNTELQNDLYAMVKEFRRADCVIQAIDIGGLRGERGDATNNPGHAGLFYMANETGGELFKDGNNLGNQLERVLRRTQVTYLLRFQPKDLKLDGDFRRLKVRLADGAQRGLRISHRQGYYAPRPFEELHPLEKQLLAAGAIATAGGEDSDDSGPGLDLLVTPFRANEASAYVPVILEIDGAWLRSSMENVATNLSGRKAKRARKAMRKQAENQPIGLEIYVYVTDEQGAMRDFFTQAFGVRLADTETRDLEGLKYYGHLMLAPGAHRVRVLVRNAASGATLVRSIETVVPDYADRNLAITQPLFLDDPTRWLLVRQQNEQLQSANNESVVYPFTVNGEIYIPAARPNVPNDDEARFCLVAYHLPSGAIEVNSVVRRNDGSVVSPEMPLIARVERTVTGIRGYDKLLATLATDRLSPGDYTLELAVGAGSGQRSVDLAPIPFTVRN